MRVGKEYASNMLLRCAEYIRIADTHYRAANDIIKLREDNPNDVLRFRNHISVTVQNLQVALKINDELRSHAVDLDRDFLDKERLVLIKAIESMPNFLEEGLNTLTSWQWKFVSARMKVH